MVYSDWIKQFSLEQLYVFKKSLQSCLDKDYYSQTMRVMDLTHLVDVEKEIERKKYEKAKEQYRSGKWSMKIPPVCTNSWDEDSWIKWIFGVSNPQKTNKGTI